MKFEIWNKKTKSFEIVQLSEEQYEEMLNGFSIVEIEHEIKERMIDMLTRSCLKFEENAVFYKYD